MPEDLTERKSACRYIDTLQMPSGRSSEIDGIDPFLTLLRIPNADMTESGY